MRTTYRELQEQLSKLENEIQIAQISNDSYYLSPQYKAHQNRRDRIMALIKSMQKSDLSTDNKK